MNDLTIKKLFSRVVPAVVLICVAHLGGQAASADDQSSLSGREVVAKCGIKHAGVDQRSRLTVILQNSQQGTEKRSVYSRYWKSYAGQGGVFDKMLLFTEYPPDAVGSAFMRVAYESETGKEADQWIYLPLLKKIRRVTIRDPSDSFLNSDLSYADVAQRPLDADQHNFLGVKQLQEMEFYQVESIPVAKDDIYARRVQWYLKGESWDSCVSARIDYYTKDGALDKVQFNKWQQVNGAWVWDRVLVRKILTGHVSVFMVSDVEVDVGLSDSLFSARTLRIGPRALGKKRADKDK